MDRWSFLSLSCETIKNENGIPRRKNNNIIEEYLEHNVQLIIYVKGKEKGDKTLL